MLQPIQPQRETAEGQAFYEQKIAEITSHLEAVRDLPGLDTFRETKALARAFFKHFNAFLAAYDGLIEFALDHSGDGQRIECKKGCANCCIDLVRGMTTPEIINIYNHVRSWPDVKQIFDYHRASALKFMGILAAKMKTGEKSPPGADPRVAEAHVEYNRLNRPCGFLDTQTGCCRIYPVRPIACRYFFSFDPAEMCSPLHVKYLNRQTRTVHLPEEIHALLREIDHKFGFRPMNYLSGAFCEFAVEVMGIEPIAVTDE
jgi:Fe-S-cluster containining protein